jgi:polyhydroxyalkanoate synthesis regulator phasin
LIVHREEHSMPQSKSPSASSKGGGRSKQAKRSPGNRRKSSPASDRRSAGVGDSISGLIELLVNRVIKPFDMVLLTRDRIQDVLDEAAERGRVTRTDANDLVAELVRRGRQQTDELLRRARLAEPLDQILRAADRARRSVAGTSPLPISGYDELTASQVTKKLPALTPAELRRVRDYEERHANRKSVLDAIQRALR